MRRREEASSQEAVRPAVVIRRPAPVRPAIPVFRPAISFAPMRPVLPVIARPPAPTHDVAHDFDGNESWETAPEPEPPEHPGGNPCIIS